MTWPHYQRGMNNSNKNLILLRKMYRIMTGLYDWIESIILFLYFFFWLKGLNIFIIFMYYGKCVWMIYKLEKLNETNNWMILNYFFLLNIFSQTWSHFLQNIKWWSRNKRFWWNSIWIINYARQTEVIFELKLLK